MSDRPKAVTEKRLQAVMQAFLEHRRSEWSRILSSDPESATRTHLFIGRLYVDR